MLLQEMNDRSQKQHKEKHSPAEINSKANGRSETEKPKDKRRTGNHQNEGTEPRPTDEWKQNRNGTHYHWNEHHQSQSIDLNTCKLC